MNETMSLVLATAILAIGGLGLYMYKQPDNDFNYDDDDNSSGSESDLESDLESELGDEYLDNYEPKVVQRGKTKRSKPSGGTRKKNIKYFI